MFYPGEPKLNSLFWKQESESEHFVSILEIIVISMIDVNAFIYLYVITLICFIKYRYTNISMLL